jgi:hypothetical protein
MKQSILRFKFLKTAVAWSLLLAIVFAACSKNSTPPPPPPDKTALQDTITVAQSLYNGTVEGTKPGQYEVGSKADLQTAIDAGNGVVADASVTQQQVTSATANVHAAIETYKSHLINEISAANLMGFWKFNGNTNDSSGNGRDGVATQGHAYYGGGNLVLTADRFGRAGSQCRSALQFSAESTADVYKSLVQEIAGNKNAEYGYIYISSPQSLEWI